MSDCEAKLRLIRDGPFCWQHKGALEIIREAFDSTNDVSSALAVYLGLSEIASDCGSDTFTAAKALIAHKAGLSVRTVQRLLNGFEQLGIVQIERQFAEQHTGAIRAANTYTLLSLVSLGNHCSTPFGNEAASSISDKTDTNKGKQRKTNDSAGARVNKTARPKEEKISSSGYQHQNQPARDHVKWSEFCKWCSDQPRQLDKRGRSKPNIPTEAGFWKWLCGQKPYWRDKVRQDPAGEAGYVLDGKFLTDAKANQLAMGNPALIEKMQRAVKRDGQIIIQPKPVNSPGARTF